MNSNTRNGNILSLESHIIANLHVLLPYVKYLCREYMVVHNKEK